MDKISDLFKREIWSDSALAENIVKRIENLSEKLKNKVNIMEVCGTHTMSIAESGIRSILPGSVNLISGPGCPVCVTSSGDIDRILSIASKKDVIIASFGDMLKVKGSRGKNLHDIRISGGDVRVVYSPFDALKIAKENKDKNVVFIAVGFETTAPLIAAVVKAAKIEKVNNFFITPLFKLVPPALKFLLDSKIARIDAFILPGHVSAIIGYKPYEFLINKYKIPCAVAGFEPIDILRGINLILEQIVYAKPRLDVEYSRVVKENGNEIALKLMSEVFDLDDANWRAIGVIQGSGYRLAAEYKNFDAFEKFEVSYKKSAEPKGCLCGAVLLGISRPIDCKHFAKTCTPTDAIGPCMVSSEGACAAWYKYGIKR